MVVQRGEASAGGALGPPQAGAFREDNGPEPSQSRSGEQSKEGM